MIYILYFFPGIGLYNRAGRDSPPVLQYNLSLEDSLTTINMNAWVSPSFDTNILGHLLPKYNRPSAGQSTQISLEDSLQPLGANELLFLS